MTKNETKWYDPIDDEERRELKREIARLEKDVEFWKTMFDRAQKTSESLSESNKQLIINRYCK